MTEAITATTPYELNDAFPNLEGLNRLERAAKIANTRNAIRKVKPQTYTVKSQQGLVSYVVSKDAEGNYKCSCPDHLLNGCECKHIIAVKMYLEERSQDLSGKKAKAESEGKEFRDWSNYSLAQMSESELFPIYLKELVNLVKEPEKKAGRPSIPLADNIYMAVSKVASLRSSRRAYGEIVNAEKAGNIERQYGYNNVNVFLNRADVTPLLRELLRASAQPLSEIEHIFAIDASGFGTYQFGDWLDDKWAADDKRKHTYVKAHVACGVVSNIITDAVVTSSSVADMNELQTLLDGTCGRFKADEVLADKGYLSNKNYAYIKKSGARGYIDFKENVTGRGCPAWREAFLNFLQHRDEFYAHYHKRSNVETTFGAIKAKYQEKLKSKNEVAQMNELYCKMIAYNISVVIRMAFTQDVNVAFK
ncbi:MAG TPA: transposase [Methanocorpusculum sp.]|nr:transposase [Methanocorpusculum sp.]